MRASGRGVLVHVDAQWFQVCSWKPLDAFGHPLCFLTPLLKIRVHHRWGGALQDCLLLQLQRDPRCPCTTALGIADLGYVLP